MKAKTYLKLFTVNIAVICTIILAPLIAYDAWKALKPLRGQTVDARHGSPAYEEGDMSYDFFKNKDLLGGTYAYKSFIGWRPPEYKSKTLTIQPKLNNRISINEEINNSVWFFGGSTMWGFGASDTKTIPSIFSTITNENVFNFGEVAWTSRQSLNQLIAVLDTGKIPRHVVFYDGNNDALVQCKFDRYPTHAREQQIADFAARGSATTLSLIHHRYIDLTQTILSRFFKQPKNNSFACIEDRDYAYNVARGMVNSWHTAYLLSKRAGSGFTAILQPHAYTSNQEHEYIQGFKDENHRKVLEAFYSDVKTLINEICHSDKEFCKSFHDGSKWIKPSEMVYIDSVHMTPKGNRIVAHKIASIIQSGS